MESVDPSKAGIASLTASMLNEASEKYSAEEISSRLSKLGSTISFSGGTNQTTIWVESLTKNLDSTLVLLEERLLHPKFDQVDFDRLKKQSLEAIANQKTQPGVVASNVFNRLLYGEANIKAIPVIGNTNTVATLTLDDVKAFYKANLSPTLTNLVIVGDVEQQQIMPKLAFLKKWAATKAVVPEEGKTAAIDKARIYLVDKEKAAQSEIRIGYLALPFDATGDYYRSKIMNYPLGGAFGSRINLNLREDKGYTYGAGSYFSGNLYAGPYTAYAGVRSNVTDSAVMEFIKEIKMYAESGISDSELRFTRNAIGQSDALKYETAYQKANFLDDIITYNLEADFVNQQTKILKSISKAEIDALGKKYLPLDKMVIVVVGDKALIKPGLQKLGYEIVETDTDGKPLTML
jgi:zinc protease